MTTGKTQKNAITIASISGFFWKTAFTLALLCVYAGTVKAAILFQNDSFTTIPSDGIILNSDDEASGDMVLQFGQTLGESLRWSAANARFEFSNNVDLTNHQLSTARIENVTALPGGASGLGASGTGRLVELTATDSTAPGCTGPSCAPGTYSWNGSIWRPLTGNITTSNATKIITVGPTGRDYTNIADAAAYCNTISGCEIWIDPGTYPVTTSVDLENTKLIGADGNGITQISISGGGRLQVKDTFFYELDINVGAISGAIGLDVKYNPSSYSSVLFSKVNFSTTAGKYILGSTASTPPVTIINFMNCAEAANDPGAFINTQALSGLNSSSAISVINLLSKNPLKLSDWPVTIVGGSNVVTSGNIISVPDRTIYISPGMNIQGAITSLGAKGGVIKLGVGVHDVTDELVIKESNIQIEGEGPGTILRAQTATWPGGKLTADNAVIQVGGADGNAPVNNVIIRNFVLQVGPNIHGIAINGGSENKVMDMVVQSIGPKSTPGPRAGIVFTDGATTAGRRFTATRNIINSDIPANRWIDGIHIDGGTEASLSGQLFGYNNGIYDSIISENIVAEARQTSYAFTNIYSSGIFSNRARDLGWDSGAFGLFVNNARDVNVINNTMDGNHNTSNTGIILYSDVVNSIVVGNSIRGNVGICSPPGLTDCLINIGINISGAVGGNTGNIVTDNQISNATTIIQDNGANSKLESNYHRATVNPTATDDISKGYGIGTIWINTSTGGVFISVNSTAGAAVWASIISNLGHAQNTDTGTNSNTFTLDNDNTGGNVDLIFGAANNKILRWDNAAGELTTVNAGTNIGTYLKISGGTAITGHVSATQANLTTNSIAARTCGNYGTITVTGASVGDTAIATPTADSGGIETTNLAWSALVTAANTVTIRACNPTGAAINTADTQTWRADVWKH